MSDIEFIYVQPDGVENTVSVAEGTTLMEAALFNGVDGVQGLCGGICSCATCHVALDEATYRSLEPANEGEQEMIEQLDDRVATSRLGCQIHADAKINGARVRVLGTGA
jgi:2Fe-2S ferredoxin